MSEKEYEIICYMTNGDIFKLLFKSQNIEDLNEYIQNSIKCEFMSNGDATTFIRVENVNCFEIKEKNEEVPAVQWLMK